MSFAKNGKVDHDVTTAENQFLMIVKLIQSRIEVFSSSRQFFSSEYLIISL